MNDQLNECLNLITPALQALDAFEKTGSRVGFEAWLDQMDAFERDLKEENKND